MENIESTKNQYWKDGNYTSERLVIHEQIINQLIKDIRSSDNPTANFLGGGSGSGKSSIANLLIQQFKEKGEDVVLIDSDKIKTMLPEYNTLIEKNPAQAAMILHDESSDISTKLFQKCLENKLNFIFDGTMKNKEKYESFIESARQHKFEVSVSIADVPLEEAKHRAKLRYETERRYVPVEIIEESHRKVPVTFQALKDKVDSFYLYDTTHIHPVQFYVKEKGKVKVLDQEHLSEFYAKANAPQQLQELKKENLKPVEMDRESWTKVDGYVKQKNISLERE